MQIHSFTVGPFAENTYLLTEDSQALIVDPGFLEDGEFQKVQSHIKNDGSSLEAVILTHAHVDHVLGLQKVLDEFDVPVYLNDRDRYLWDNFPSQAAMFGFQSEGFAFDPEPLKVQSNWTLGNFEFEVRYTPGHSPGPVTLCSKGDGGVIARHGRFRAGRGRTDLP
jgi:glyoxylase-like metal-dependent hydrolase (beta-lactamase superfamily II)